MKLLGALLCWFLIAQAQPTAMPLSIAACGAIHAFNETGLVLHGTIGQAGAGYVAVGNLEAHAGFWGAREFAMPPLAIESVGTMPSEFAVHAAYPNPFNPSTRLSFSLPDAAHVTLRLFDVTGRQIETLADEQYSAGSHAVTWNAARYASGTYFARLEALEFSHTQELHLIK